MLKSLVFLLFVGLVFNASALTNLSPKRNRYLGNMFKNYLENYHYLHLKINDDISKKAFGQYLKKLDYGKQILLKSDIDKLKKYELKMDDQLINGQYNLLKDAVGIFQKRIKNLEKMRVKIFKKKFNFKKKEYLELDPDKRKWPTTTAQLREHWRKTYKQAVLARYLSLLEGQKEKKDDKKNKKTVKNKKKAKAKIKAPKKLTKKEALKKARVAIAKKYKKFFSRLLKNDYENHLDDFYNAISTVFDPHTNYMPPKRKEDFDIDMSGSLTGIGAVLQEDGAYIKVVRIVPGGAAWRQKELEVGDVILMVAQQKGSAVDLVDMRVDDAVRFIRGKKGTVVKLTVKKADGSNKLIKIVRDVVQIGASFAKSSIIEHKKVGHKIGYIYLPKFYRDFSSNGRNCTDDVKKEVLRLKKKNVQAIILDLRNNSGGALEDARGMSGLFIPQGPIVQIRDHEGKINVMQDLDSSVTFGGPLVVMTNRFSASASEILAGAMQDYKRAVIVGGEHSHGKGTVQAVLGLNQGPLFSSVFGDNLGALKVTIQKFYRITGASTQYKGVTPDIILPDPLSYAKNREQDLDYSLKWDQVPARKFKTWKKFGLPMQTLRKRSVDRISKSKAHQKMKESIDFLVKRRDDTRVSLNLKEVQARDKESKEMAKKLKYDFVNDDIVVSNYEASMKSAEKVKVKDAKKWHEDFKRRKEEWVGGLKKDANLAEAYFIASDLINSIHKKPLKKLAHLAELKEKKK